MFKIVGKYCNMLVTVALIRDAAWLFLGHAQKQKYTVEI